MKKYLRVKLQNLRVTGKELNYSGSLKLGKRIMDEAGFEPYEVVLVVNVETGARFETYVNPGEAEEVVLQGGAARLGEVGDRLIVMGFVWAEAPPGKPKILVYG